VSLKNTADSYGLLAKTLHWVMALILISMVAFGLFVSDLPRGEEKSVLIRLHASTGLLAMMLLLARFGWKLGNASPVSLSDIKWQARLAALVHWLFYGVIAFQVVSGSMSLMTVGWDLPFFGLFNVPTPYARDMDLHHFWEELHVAGWYAFAAAFALHVAGVVYHQFVSKKKALKRML